MKQIPKSLHTITVLARVARLVKPQHPNASDEQLIAIAAIELGYVDAADPYMLKFKALKALQQ